MNLLERIQDIFYDIVGFLVPGIFALALLLPLVLHGHTFAYIFFTNGPLAMIFEMESLQSAHHSVMTIILLCFLAYIMGHVIRIVPIFFSSVHKRCQLHRQKRRQRKGKGKKSKRIHFCFLTSWIRLVIKKNFSYIDDYARTVIKKFKTQEPDNWNLYFRNSPNQQALLKTYVNTHSRFQKHSNHLMKYHNKKSLFYSLKVVCGFLLADFAITGLILSLLDFFYLVASLVLVYQTSSQGFLKYCVFGCMELAKLVLLPTLKKLCEIFLVYLLYCTFYYEEARHEKLLKKELAFYMDNMMTDRNRSSH